jgi:3-oxoacyl-[acyl-carrier-protein] synthase-1
MVTSVGFNSPASLAAIRAGIRNVNETNLWDAESGEYIAAGRVSLPHWWVGLGKLAELVAPAIHECLIAAKPVPAEKIPILLGTAAPDRPFRFEHLDEQILDEIQYKLEIKLHPESRVIPRGRVSGVIGIQLAQHLIESREIPCCIVAGVDSFVQQNVVEAYLEKRRILTPVNSNGFSPGEAGSAVLVTPTGRTPEGELQILGIGTGTEKATIESEEPLRGDGLVEAIRKALSDAGITISDISYRITDLNGEHYKFKEATFVIPRLMKKPRGVLFDIWHPIEYIGEVGAAIGPCALAIALHAGQKSYNPSVMCLCHFSNDNGERGAIVVGFYKSTKN